MSSNKFPPLRFAPKWATISAVARKTGRSERGIRELIYKGKIDAYRVPGVRGMVVDLYAVEQAMTPRAKVRPLPGVSANEVVQ